MTYSSVHDPQSTGEICPGCDSEVVVSPQGATLLLECDCGSVAALGPTDLAPAA